MAAITLNILKPSVNNLTVRIFVRAAGLDFEEVDVWGKTRDAGVPREGPRAPDADDRGGGPAARDALGELRDHAVPLQQARARPVLSRRDPAERAMVDSAMFYLIGTLYPLVARATYPALGFPQYPGEVGSLRTPTTRAKAQRAEGRRRRRSPSRSTSTARSSSTASRSSAATRRRSPTSASRRRSSSCARSTTTSRAGPRSTWPRWRRRSATPTRSRPPTCAATSST